MNALERNPQGHVYSGRGEHYKRLNIPFRLKVQRDSPRYVATANNDIKHQIAEDLYREICQNGGLFLDQAGEEMSERAALKKIKKALKDGKKQVVKRAQKKDSKIRPTAPNSSDVSRSDPWLAGCGLDHLEETFSCSSSEDADAFVLSSGELPPGDSLLGHPFDGANPQSPETVLQMPTIETYEGSQSNSQEFVFELGPDDERLLQELMTDFDVDDDPVLSDSKVTDIAWQDDLEPQHMDLEDRPAPNGEETRGPVHLEAPVLEEAPASVPVSQYSVQESMKMPAVFQNWGLQEFDDMSVDQILDVIQRDEFVW